MATPAHARSSHVEVANAYESGDVEEKVPVDLRTMLGGDCGPEVRLQWGEVVEIPEADHPLNESWNGIDGTLARVLSRCLNRTVTVTVKGQSTRVRVKRAAAETVPAGEWLIDCTQIGDGGDFWLRDGDGIEVKKKML